MAMKLFTRKQLLIAWGLLFILVTITSCQGSSKPIGNKTATVSSGPQVNTLIPYTETSTASQLPTETQTQEPKITPTVTIPPTIVWTPLPTLEANKAEMQVLDLLNNNAGCRLPCWWGITPGETSTTNTVQFLSSFTDLDTSWGSSGHEQSGPVQPGSIIGDLGSSYRVFGDYGNIEYTFRDGFVDTISAYHGGGTGDHRVDTYQLSRILTSYGKPDEAVIFAAPTAPGGASLDLYIFYDLGIFVHYLYFNVEFVGSNMRVCPQGIGPEELQLWSPKTRQLTLDSYLPGTTPLPALQATIGVDLETFYRLYQSPENRACLETPTDLWMSK
jgi:hypothetical protein